VRQRWGATLVVYNGVFRGWFPGARFDESRSSADPSRRAGSALLPTKGRVALGAVLGRGGLELPGSPCVRLGSGGKTVSAESPVRVRGPRPGRYGASGLAVVETAKAFVTNL